MNVTPGLVPECRVVAMRAADSLRLKPSWLELSDDVQLTRI